MKRGFVCWEPGGPRVGFRQFLGLQVNRYCVCACMHTSSGFVHTYIGVTGNGATLTIKFSVMSEAQEGLGPCPIWHLVHQD